MKVFRLNHHEYDEEIYETCFFGTMAEAKKAASEVSKHLRADIVAAELNVQSDKEGFLAALNGEPVVIAELRKFDVTARGSLKEE